MNNDLTIRVSGKGNTLPVLSLVTVLRQSIIILREVEREINKKNRIKWVISSISMKSPATVKISGVSESINALDADIPSHALRSLRSLRAPSNQSQRMPEFFTEEAIEAAMVISKELLNGLTGVEYETPRESTVSMGLDMADTARKLVESKEYREWTTIKGALESLHVHGGEFQFIIYNKRFPSGVKCVFPKELLPQVKSDFPETAEDTSHVSVYGKSFVSLDGRVKRIEVQEYHRITPSRPYSELPPTDISGGLSSEDHVNQVRYGSQGN